MIFVTVGTQDKKFNRLFEEIHKCISEGKIKDEVIAQIGCSDYPWKDIKTYKKVSYGKVNELMKKCDIIVTHGGVGSIIQGLENNKKVIAVPRLSKYKEAVNNHQLEIVNDFFEKGYILKVEKIEDLFNVIKNASKFKPKKYKSNQKLFISKLRKYIEEI